MERWPQLPGRGGAVWGGSTRLNGRAEAERWTEPSAGCRTARHAAGQPHQSKCDRSSEPAVLHLTAGHAPEAGITLRVPAAVSVLTEHVLPGKLF